MKQIYNIQYFTDESHFKIIAQLPWYLDLGDWVEQKKIRELKIRKGNHRHPIIFIVFNDQFYAIKQISPNVAEKEIKFYEILHKKHIPAITPIGFVRVSRPPLKMENVIGQPLIPDDEGFLITQLERDVIPDNDVVRFGFSKDNEEKVWNAVVELFVNLHTNNIYWGDGSMNNVLIRFKKIKYPNSERNKTILEAILVDTETMEIYDSISNKRRMEDWEIFFDSLQWTLEDLSKTGIKKKTNYNLLRKKLLKKYDEWFSITKERQRFENLTRLDSEAFDIEWLPDSYFDIFIKQVEEHKWYMSEQSKSIVSLENAAFDWYKTVFLPTTHALSEKEIEQILPNKSPTELYVEIMQHKYFLGLKMGKDVGVSFAVKDYCVRFGHHKNIFPVIEKFMKKFDLDKLKSMLQNG